MRKSQTATEYLIILAMVIVVGLIVVGVLGGIPSIGGSVSKNSAQAILTTQDVAIENWAIDATGATFIIRNNLQSTVRIDSMIVEGMEYNSSTLLKAGQSKKITTSSIYSKFGTKYSMNLAITYTDVLTGATYNINSSSKGIAVVGEAPSAQSYEGKLYEDLLVWYRYDGNLEEVVSGYDATMQNIDYAAGKLNQGVLLNSLSDILTYPLNDMILPYNYTQAIWFKTPPIPDGPYS
jgi:hypothetical protein